MYDAEKMMHFQTVTGEQDCEIAQYYLESAKSKILRRVYPFGVTDEEIPEEYSAHQIDIAVYLYNKRGAEGQTSHSENGISRTYEDADVPESMLRGIYPYCGVI